jgi:YidC/Oxa1 family membrane protein insertase
VDKRSVLALVLCLFIFIGWMWLSAKIWPPQQPPAATPHKPDSAVQAPKPGPEKPDPVKPDPVKPDPSKQVDASRYNEKPPITIRSKYLDVVLTNKGAGVHRATLFFPKDRAAAAGLDPKKSQVEILQAYDPKVPHLALRQVGGLDEIESAPWDVVVDPQQPNRAEFKYLLRNGVEITKIFTIDPNSHQLQLEVRLENHNKKPEGKSEPVDVPMQLELVAVNGLDPDSLYRYENYLMGVYRYDHSLLMKSFHDIQTGESKHADAVKSGNAKDIAGVEDKYFKVAGGRKEWFGVKNRFFTTLVAPDNSALDLLDSYSFRLSPPAVTKGMTTPTTSPKNVKGNITVSALSTTFQVGAARRVIQFNVFAGPLEKETLREAGQGAEDLGGYTGGCFLGFVIKPAATVILSILRFTASFLHNMGLGIIATTLFIRLCLFPLSLKSQRNALAMQALAPKIQALKERYKDDQQKYGVEQMRLFKENKVNPVAGCLPLFIQMPVFIGMYSVFEMAIELRGRPFFGWIKDLSEPDRLFGGDWGVVIPMPLVPNIEIDALNLLPILMTITWFLQAYLTPRSPDPQMAQQQKMMMWMPIIFGLTCYGLASGLSLYFLANSLLSMAELKIIKKYILKVDATGKPLNPGPEPGSVKK